MAPDERITRSVKMQRILGELGFEIDMQLNRSNASADSELVVKAQHEILRAMSELTKGEDLADSGIGRAEIHLSGALECLQRLRQGER